MVSVKNGAAAAGVPVKFNPTTLPQSASNFCQSHNRVFASHLCIFSSLQLPNLGIYQTGTSEQGTGARILLRIMLRLSFLPPHISSCQYKKKMQQTLSTSRTISSMIRMMTMYLLTVGKASKKHTSGSAIQLHKRHRRAHQPVENAQKEALATDSEGEIGLLSFLHLYAPPFVVCSRKSFKTIKSPRKQRCTREDHRRNMYLQKKNTSRASTSL